MSTLTLKWTKPTLKLSFGVLSPGSQLRRRLCTVGSSRPTDGSQLSTAFYHDPTLPTSEIGANAERSTQRRFLLTTDTFSAR